MRIDGAVREGQAIDLTEFDVSATAVVRAIDGGGASLDVDCPTPGAAHGHVALLPPATFDRRAALADVARALGHESSASASLADARSELASLSPPSVDGRAARQRVAEAGTEEDRLRERVAELRGRVQARQEMGASTTAVEAQLNEAVRKLSEAETERIAAEQALDRAATAAREARDRRDRRLELEDRVANLERTVRCDLTSAVWDRFRSALRTVPGTATAGESPGDYDGDAATAALGVTRIAPLDAPVVVDGLDRFSGASEAVSVLDAPVIYTR
ncbi:hypothetical protein [Haloplanus halobius]|uniref:DUF7856 family protein n=1 Tax=Haloplanus halobius TaxID=2934938 RepID=UPI00200D7B25|nr:hypothetical protein [Haloplanus sp. XH21]